MLSLLYFALYCYNTYKEHQQRMRYARILARYSEHASVLLRNPQLPPPAVLVTAEDEVSPLASSSGAGWQQQLLMREEGKQLLAVTPQVHVNLKYWVSYLDKQECAQLGQAGTGKHYVLFETYPPEESQESEETQMDDEDFSQIRVTDYAAPVAWKGGTPFGIVAECSTHDWVTLIAAYMRGNLIMDDMLQLRQMMTVGLDGNAGNLLRVSSYGAGASTPPSPSVSGQNLNQTWENVIDDLHSSIAGGDTCVGSNESLASAGLGSKEILGGRASNSRCNSALSEDFRELTADCDTLCGDIGELSSDCTADFLLEDHMEPGAGEAPSGPIEELAPEALTPKRHKPAVQGKPPNILVYCGKKDSNRQFEQVKATLQMCLNADRYAIYRLTQEQVLQTPWADNTSLLVIATEKLYDGVDEAFLRYFQCGGLLVSFGSVIDDHLVSRVKTEGAAPTSVVRLSYKRWSDVMVISMPFHYELGTAVSSDVSAHPLAWDQNSNAVVMAEVIHNESQGIAILAQVNLDKGAAEMAISPPVFAALKQANPARCEILADIFEQLGLDSEVRQPPKPTTAALLCEPEMRSRFLSSIKGRISSGLLRSKNTTLKLLENSSDTMENLSPEIISLVVSEDHLPELTNFDLAEYRANLQSTYLGHTVIYADVMPTTMNIVDSLTLSMSPEQGLVVIAAIQCNGRGRGGNAWLSPIGCAMFSSHLRLPISSCLGQSASFPQHIAATAVVHAIRSLPGYQDLDIRVKWPNDIYFSDKMKMGGIFVQSSVMQSDIHFNIGIGFNVSNSNPTICLNDLIHQHNTTAPNPLAPLSVTTVIARTLTAMEEMVEQFQANGPDGFLKYYYKYWLHGGTTVELEKANGLQCKILGLDQYGYLLVEKPDGTTDSLHPDGNSFDMMRNLILMKDR